MFGQHFSKPFWASMNYTRQNRRLKRETWEKNLGISYLEPGDTLRENSWSGKAQGCAPMLMLTASPSGSVGERTICPSKGLIHNTDPDSSIYPPHIFPLTKWSWFLKAYPPKKTSTSKQSMVSAFIDSIKSNLIIPMTSEPKWLINASRHAK